MISVFLYLSCLHTRWMCVYIVKRLALQILNIKYSYLISMIKVHGKFYFTILPNIKRYLSLYFTFIWHYSRYGLNPITLMLPVN